MARIQPIRAVVDELLSEHQINRPSDIDVMRIASSMGIEVRQSQMDGCAANIVGLGDAAIVTVDSRGDEGRQRFSIAHEIGHWIYDRGNGLSLCDAQDLATPWSSKAKSNPKERRANQFAAELLMPRSMFRIQSQNLPFNLNTVEVLRSAFSTSRTATAIRLVELGTSLAILALFDRNGKRAWFCSSADVPRNFYPHRLLPNTSGIWKEVVTQGRLVSSVEITDGDDWIEHVRSSDMTIECQGMRVRNHVMVLIAFPDESDITELLDNDDEFRWR